MSEDSPTDLVPARLVNQENAAPGYLLPRAPVMTDYPISLKESASRNMTPYIYGPEAMEAGQSFQFAVSVFDCCLTIRPVEVAAAWSTKPPGLAVINPLTGLLVVDETAPHGSVITVSAKVKGVSSALTADLTIFSREQNPLVGRWQEDRASGGVRELLFQSDGQFAATWVPLEGYMDLFGTYTVDAATMKVELIKSWDRTETPGFEGPGDYHFDDHDRLLLMGVCPSEPDPENPDCIRRFVRSK